MRSDEINLPWRAQWLHDETVGPEDVGDFGWAIIDAKGNAITDCGEITGHHAKAICVAMNKTSPSTRCWVADAPDGEGSAIVWAATRGKARSLLCKTDELQDIDFVDVRLRRYPAFDGRECNPPSYRERYEMGGWWLPCDGCSVQLSVGGNSEAVEWDGDRCYCQDCASTRENRKGNDQ